VKKVSGSVPLLPGDDGAKDLLGGLLVADEIVVDQEDDPSSQAILRVNLRDHLGGLLDARPPAEDDDDVAEFTLVRAAARRLDTAHGVFAKPDQIVTRQRDLRHVGLRRLLVTLRMLPARPFLEKAGPGLLGLSHEDHVDKAVKPVLRHADPGPSHDREDAPVCKLDQDLAHPVALDRHAGDSHDVERLERVEVDLFDVLVNDHNLVLGRRQPGQHGQRQHGHVGPFAEQGKTVIQTPERDREAGINKAYACHVWVLFVRGRLPRPRPSGPLGRDS